MQLAVRWELGLGLQEDGTGVRHMHVCERICDA